MGRRSTAGSQAPQSQTTSAEALSRVREIYRELEARPVTRACERRTDCCRFKLTGRTPYVTKAEALLAASAVRSAGKTRIPTRTDGDCPLLEHSGRCSIYEARPFACRTHFCAAAGGMIARREIVDLIHRLEDLDAALGGNGAHALPEALARALESLR